MFVCACYFYRYFVPTGQLKKDTKIFSYKRAEIFTCASSHLFPPRQRGTRGVPHLRQRSDHLALCTHRYCLSALCRPYGAKIRVFLLYPPLTQWATVVTPLWGVFSITAVLPHAQCSESMTIVPACHNNIPQAQDTFYINRKRLICFYMPR